METCKCLYNTFYKTFEKDVENLLPEGERQSFASSLQSLAFSSDRDADDLYRNRIVNLAKLGKAFEACVVRHIPFVNPVELWRDSDPSVQLPTIFRETFLWFFRLDGSLREDDALSFLKRTDGELALRFLLLRQALLAFSKVKDVEAIADPEDEVNAFIQRVTKRPYSLSYCSPSAINFHSRVVPIARKLLQLVLMDDNNQELCAPLAQWREDPFGRHGPGAVAGGEHDTEKWQLFDHPRLSKKLLDGQMSALSTIKFEDERVNQFTSRLAVVPKDVVKNRLICIEPKELMYAQQGIMKVLYKHLSSSLFTRRAIHFDDQSYNFRASRHPSYSTIDLSDASDMLSITLCKLLLPRKAFCLFSRYRSSFIELPNGECIRYSSMATMGNALCFPIESLIFWSLSLAAMLSRAIEQGEYASVQEVNFILQRRPWPILRRYPLYVFGDDIIVPNQYCDDVCENLEVSGLKVNINKTCRGENTPVRESCGSYWWGPFDVRYVKFPYARVFNALHYLSTSEKLADFIRTGFNYLAEEIHGCLALIKPLPHPFRDYLRKGVEDGWIRFNPDLQRLERRAPVAKAAGQWSFLPGDVGLYAYFTDQATKPISLGDAQCVIWEWVPLDLDLYRS